MSEPGKVSSKILAVRSAWQFVYLNAFLNTFSDCVDKLEVDPAILEHELVRKVPGELLGDIHRALIKPLSISKSNEPWEKSLSRLLTKHIRLEEAYPFTENPIPLENSEAYHLLPATTKLDLLWLLCDWHLQNNKDVRVKIDQIQRKAHNMDKSALNILSSQPVGFDKQQRSYWFFGDWPRVYRRKKNTSNKPYSYDTWEVVATTIDELFDLIEVFRMEFLNTESELKNALQRLLARSEAIQKRHRQQEKARERALALLDSTEIRETRTRVRRQVVRYEFETAEDDIMEDDSNYITENDHQIQHTDNIDSDHSNNNNINSSIDDVESMNGESDKDRSCSDQSESAQQNKRKRRNTKSSLEPPESRRGIASDNGNGQTRPIGATAVAQVPTSRQQTTLDTWANAIPKAYTAYISSDDDSAAEYRSNKEKASTIASNNQAWPNTKANNSTTSYTIDDDDAFA